MNFDLYMRRLGIPNEKNLLLSEGNHNVHRSKRRLDLEWIEHEMLNLKKPRRDTLNNKPKLILSIETSCDESSASILSFHSTEQSSHKQCSAPLATQHPKILSNVVHSQIQHTNLGGVVPEIAAREHEKHIHSVVKEALSQANVSLEEIDYFSATCGPGLIGGIIVGVTFAKTLATIFQKPFIPVNHLVGHALAPRIQAHNISYEYKKSKRDMESLSESLLEYSQNEELLADSSSVHSASGDSSSEYSVSRNSESKTSTSTTSPLKNPLKDSIPILFPYLLLLISGGHCQIVLVKDAMTYEIIGETLDDALGETFDKVAKLLGLPYPGGKYIEEYAKNGNENAFEFPMPMIHSKDCNMSFSGLKTAVRMQIEKDRERYKEYRENHETSDDSETSQNYNNSQLNSTTNTHDTHKKHDFMTKQYISDIAASFSKAATNVLIRKISKAIKLSQEKILCPTKIQEIQNAQGNQFKNTQDDDKEDIANNKEQNEKNANNHNRIQYVVISGGVAANNYIYSMMKKVVEGEYNMKFVAPISHLCTDNGAMIAWATYEMITAGYAHDDINFVPKPRWNLEDVD